MANIMNHSIEVGLINIRERAHECSVKKTSRACTISNSTNCHKAVQGIAGKQERQEVSSRQGHHESVVRWKRASLARVRRTRPGHGQVPGQKWPDRLRRSGLRSPRTAGDRAGEGPDDGG